MQFFEALKQSISFLVLTAVELDKASNVPGSGETGIFSFNE